ncbi:MAG: arginine--tRNA ligase [Candidatus Omnitrophota bacterium]
MEALKSKIISVLADTVNTLFFKPENQNLPQIYLEIPKNKQFGDLSTNIAMQIAKSLGKDTKEIAGLIVDALERKVESKELKAYIKAIKVQGGGFINFYFNESSLYNGIYEVLKKGKNFGRSAIGEDKKILIEFVSANPTGSLSIAHARQAAVGDSLSNILLFSGWNVSKEYYINDEGNQINLLGESIRARYRELLGKEAQFPQNGYKGSYIYDMANMLIEKFKDTLLQKELSFFAAYGATAILAWIKEDLKEFGVHFDTWFSQKELSHTDKIDESLGELKKKGFIYEQEGALWFKSTAFGDDKDRVVVKSDGTFTYITPDIAYHREKFIRGFNRLINIWGPDHHGYIARLKAAVSALGFGDDSVTVLIVQLVTLYKDKAVVPMSTREGQFITLKELLAEVGKDAARYFFLMRKIDSHLDFDLELAKKQSPENPVFYVQYAHARISSILKNAGIQKSAFLDSNLVLLTQPEEIDLIKFIMRFPETVQQAAGALEPYRLIPYLEGLAKSLHSFYDKHKVIGEDKELTVARLALVEAVRIVLENGLMLIGVSAPEEM